MPRKWHFQAPFYGAWQGVGIRNDNPDKGTEIRILHRTSGKDFAIRNDNPDKGTEIEHLKVSWFIPLSSIRNDNPDKGTEMCKSRSLWNLFFLRLEMITPIRGRKSYNCLFFHISTFLIRNDNPDKGTEINTGLRIKQIGKYRLEMITPIRGRKYFSDTTSII